MLNIVCHDLQVEPVLQELTGELLTRGTNQAPDARLDVHPCGFCLFDVRVFHPNAESYKDLTIQHEKKRLYCMQTGFLKLSKGLLLL